MGIKHLFFSAVLLCAAGCNVSVPPEVDKPDVCWNGLVSVELAMATFNTDLLIDSVDQVDPDPDKCVCKGTGWITHGDGHKTACPYHSKSAEPAAVDPQCTPRVIYRRGIFGTRKIYVVPEECN